MLYIRMLLSMVVSLYTSRVVLNTLGVEDYGIYGVVGGVVAMFSFLNASMSGATSRFLSFEMGRGDFSRLKEIFNSALIIHIGIALIVFVLAETIGLWFLIHKLVIPEERMFAAHIVYQLSVLSTMINITQVPYNAAIIAHEKMDIYAYVELLNVALKLLIVFLLPVFGNDKLIVYSSLVLAVSLFIAFVYRIYCIKHYDESHFYFILKKEIVRPMLSFSGWDLYGNMSFTMRQQGLVFMINIFFGPVFNAASGIATTVQGTLLALSTNIITAFRPQIIKLYSQNRINEMTELLIYSMQLCVLLFGIMTIPLLFDLSYVFKLWLVHIPEKSIEITRIILLTNLLILINLTVNIPIHATGKIKILSMVSGTINWVVLIPIYLFYYWGYKIEVAYWAIFLIGIINIVAVSYILKILIPKIEISRLYYNGLVKFIFLFLLSGLGTLLLYKFIQEGMLRLFSLYFFNIILFTIYTFVVIFTSKQREMIVSKLIKRKS